MPPSTIPAPSFSHLQPFKTKGKRSWRNKGSRLLAKKKKKEATAAKVAKNKRSKEKRRSQSQEQSEGAKKWAGEENWQEMLIFFFFFFVVFIFVYIVPHWGIITLSFWLCFRLPVKPKRWHEPREKLGGGSENVGGEIVGPRGQQQQWLTDWLPRDTHTHIYSWKTQTHTSKARKVLLFL